MEQILIKNVLCKEVINWFLCSRRHTGRYIFQSSAAFFSVFSVYEFMLFSIEIVLLHPYISPTYTHISKTARAEQALVFVGILFWGNFLNYNLRKFISRYFLHFKIRFCIFSQTSLKNCLKSFPPESLAIFR